MLKKHHKTAIVILLLLSCVASGVLYYSVPPKKIYRLDMNTQLDSLIEAKFELHYIPSSSVRKYVVPIDSLFTRSVYRVIVPSYFPKTGFHFDLHHSLKPYRIETPARVFFPQNDMNIYIYDKDHIRSTIRFITETPKPDSLP